MAIDLEYIGGSSWMESLRNNLETIEAAIPAKGTHTVTAGEETAGTLSVDTGLTAPTGFIVQILRAGAVATSDAALSLSDSDLVVADGSTYAMTDGDVINWIAFE
jgi:hypothetical protein